MQLLHFHLIYLFCDCAALDDAVGVAAAVVVVVVIVVVVVVGYTGLSSSSNRRRKDIMYDTMSDVHLKDSLAPGYLRSKRIPSKQWRGLQWCEW
jgi:hypothetical protein